METHEDLPFDDEQSTQPQAPQPEQPAPHPSQAETLYPGKLSEWNRLREAGQKPNLTPGEIVGYEIAAQLSGLAYILDGIRYRANHPK